MNPFNWLRNKKEVVPEKKAQSSALIWPLVEGSFLEYALALGGRITAQQAMYFYRTNSTVAISVDKIASKVEQIDPVLKTEDGDLVKEHDVLTLLRRPNPFDTWQEFIGKVSRHYLLKHDSHLSMFGNFSRPPLEIYAIKPQNVSVTSAKDNFPAIYSITTGPGIGKYFREDEGNGIRFLSGAFKELYHIMGFSSRSDELQGDSPLEAAALEARQQIKGRLHNLAILENGGRLSLVFSFKDPDGIDDDEHKSRKRRINEDLSGSANAGKIAVVSGAEVDVKELGATNKDMDYAKLDRVASDAIYLRYEIPLPLISTDASTYNNMENALFDFYENTVLPLADILLSGISKVILPRYGIDDMTLTYDPESINLLIRQKLKEIKERRDINIESINELRSLIPNKEDVDGGEVIYQNATLIPLGEDITGDIEGLTPEELEARRNEED